VNPILVNEVAYANPFGRRDGSEGVEAEEGALKHRKSRGLLGWYIFVRQETE
jgi:hypothetical protein